MAYGREPMMGGGDMYRIGYNESLKSKEDK